MYWSTEDHRHHQQNYYNNFQIVQHQNGIQQATAAVPPQQQQHPTPPPPLQQQQQQQQQSTHRTAQQIPSHFSTNQQVQHQHHQWAARSILTAPPFFQQFPTTVPSSTQYCAPPAQYYHPQRVTQASVVSAPSQQRPCLPPGCAMYPMPPQAAALRQNVISQQPTTIMTPTTSTAQPMQVQYFPAAQYCQPPLGQSAYGHVIAPAVPEIPVVKHRKHAIPIIDPRTRENILERDLRKSESTSPVDALSIAATSSSTDLKESENDHEEEHHIPQKEATAENEQAVEEIHTENTEQVEEDNTDSSPQAPSEVDHVESIEETKEEVETTTEDLKKNENNHDDDTDQTQPTNSNTPVTITNKNEVGSKCSDDEDNDKETSTVEGNLPPATEVVEKPSTSPKGGTAAAATKVNKQQQTQKQPVPTGKPSSKKNKKNKRLKDTQKKQRADLMNIEHNNNTIKTTTNQVELKPKPIVSESYNLSRLTVKAKDSKENTSNSSTGGGAKQEEAVTIQRESGDVESCAATPSEDYEKSDECSNKVEDLIDTQNPSDDNEQAAANSPKLTKSEQIASEILGIESNDDNELLFLNSSVSGYEEDICSSPAKKPDEENDKAKDILFGDFSQKNPAQEVTAQMENESQEEKDDDDEFPSNTQKKEKRLAYTLQELKNLANGPASKIPPTFRGKICDIIGKNPRATAATHMQPAYQQNQMFQQMSFKDSLNYLSRNKRNKRINDVPPYQQYQQQYEQQQQQHQRNPDIIRINLSLNEEIQLAKSENAWVPAGLQICGPKAESEDDEQILKKIRGILNKLTPENFDKLLQSAANFPMTGEERMKKVMLLIFEKTVSEPNFAPTYARFCKFLFNPQNQNHGTFKTILVRRIREEFESNVNNAKAKNAKLRPLMDRLAATTDPKEQLELKAEIDDQEYQFRRRAWGTVRFIGEMFKVAFIPTNRVCTCVENLLDPQCEEKLEYMCKLLTTVGAQLEPLDKHQGTSEKTKITERLDAIFNIIRRQLEKKKGTGQKISSRVRFMMQDVLELRARSWDQKVVPMLPSREVSPAFSKGPPSSQRVMRLGGNYMPSGGYEKRRQTGDGQKNSSQLNIDVNKLMPLFNKDETTRKLGNSSLLMWKTAGRSSQQQQQQQQQQSTPAILQQSNRYQSRSLESELKESNPPQQQELPSYECERLMNGLIEVAIEEESKEEWFAKWNEISPSHHSKIIYYLLTEYLHSTKVKSPEINACTKLFISLMKENLLTRPSFNEGYQKFSPICDEILVDVPKAWQYGFNFLGPLLHHNLITFDLIWYKNWYNTPDGDKFLQSMIIHFTSEFGAIYMRSFWKSNSLRWDKFMAEERVASFITSNRFEFIENHKNVPPIFIPRSPDELVQRIKALLGQSDKDIDLIIDFISTNVHIDCSFIRNLTMFLCDYTVIYCNTPNSSNISSNSSKKFKLSDSSSSALSNPAASATTSTSSCELREELFVTKCIPLLRRCIDSKDEHELACLDAIMGRCKQLCDSPSEDLICAILMELYGEVISKESFEKWYQMRAQGDDKLTNELDAIFKKLPI